MTLDEAIKILSDHAYKGVVTLNKGFLDAEKLGIHALGTIRAERQASGNPNWLRLPGETEK